MALTTPAYEAVELGELLDAVYGIAASAHVEPRVASALAVRTLARMPCVARATAIQLPARFYERSIPNPPRRKGAKKDRS
jgi:hypothetical protein